MKDYTENNLPEGSEDNSSAEVRKNNRTESILRLAIYESAGILAILAGLMFFDVIKLPENAANIAPAVLFTLAILQVAFNKKIVRFIIKDSNRK